MCSYVIKRIKQTKSETIEKKNVKVCLRAHVPVLHQTLERHGRGTKVTQGASRPNAQFSCLNKQLNRQAPPSHAKLSRSAAPGTVIIY